MTTFILNKIKFYFGVFFGSILLSFMLIIGLIVYCVTYPYFRIIDLFKNSQKEAIIPVSEPDEEFAVTLLNVHISLITKEKELLAKRAIDRTYFKDSIQRSVDRLRKNGIDPEPIIKIASESGITIY